MYDVFIGFDPGKDGAFFAILPDGNAYRVCPKIGTKLDVHGYVGLLKVLISELKLAKFSIVAFAEDVHAIHGSSAAGSFNFGGAAWMIHTALACFNVPFILVKPKKWQSKCWAGVKIQRKMDKKRGKMVTDTKSTSLMAAKRLFAGESFVPDGRRKPHDGVVDAALIAYYGKYFHFNNG